MGARYTPASSHIHARQGASAAHSGRATRPFVCATVHSALLLLPSSRLAPSSSACSAVLLAAIGTICAGCSSRSRLPARPGE